MTHFAWKIFAALSVFLLLPLCVAGQSRRTRIAIVGFNGDGISAAVADALASIFSSKERAAPAAEFETSDRNLAITAARGAGYSGQLNMSVQEARDIGASIGCDLYFLGNAQTLRRTSSARAIYYETSASIFLVSARTGRLILWDGPTAEDDSAEQSESKFMRMLSSARYGYVVAVRRAVEDEREERASAVQNGTPVIELLANDQQNSDVQVQAPRPYRRLKPPYPDAAARAEIEATVDALVEIDAQGEVRSVQIERWAGYGLDDSVVATVKQMHFFPARRDGIPISLRVLLRYNFRKPPS